MNPLKVRRRFVRLFVGWAVLTCSFSSAIAVAQPRTQAAFEVTSVKPTPPDRQNRLRFDKCPGGGAFVSNGTPLMWLIEFAWELPDSRILGGPAWINAFDQAYDVEGKSSGPIANCRQLVRTLLEDRFKLTVRSETRETPVYELVVAKGGPKLHAAEGAGPAGGVRINGALQQGVSEKAIAPAWPISRLVSMLSGHPAVGRNVIDKTGLTGEFQFDLVFANNEAETDQRPSIFSALPAQLGLKLQPAIVPLEVIVITHIEKADPN